MSERKRRKTLDDLVGQEHGTERRPNGSSDTERIRRQLRKMAFGRPNDCVRLVLGENVDVEALDLTLLAEFRRTEKGSMEVKLIDRVRALEHLAAMAGDGNAQAGEFLEALLTGMEET